MRITFSIILLSVMIIHVPAMADESTAGTERIDLNTQAFNRLRDPFWPVEHERLSATEKIEEGKIADMKARINWPKLPLRGITHAGGKRYIAVIEGVGIVEAGDIVTKEQDSLIYRWIIDKVTAAGITSTRLDVTEKVRN